MGGVHLSPWTIFLILTVRSVLQKIITRTHKNTKLGHTRSSTFSDKQIFLHPAPMSWKSVERKKMHRKEKVYSLSYKVKNSSNINKKLLFNINLFSSLKEKTKNLASSVSSCKFMQSCNFMTRNKTFKIVDKSMLCLHFWPWGQKISFIYILHRQKAALTF